MSRKRKKRPGPPRIFTHEIRFPSLPGATFVVHGPSCAELAAELACRSVRRRGFFLSHYDMAMAYACARLVRADYGRSVPRVHDPDLETETGYP